MPGDANVNAQYVVHLGELKLAKDGLARAKVREQLPNPPVQGEATVEARLQVYRQRYEEAHAFAIEHCTPQQIAEIEGHAPPEPPLSPWLRFLKWIGWRR